MAVTAPYKQLIGRSTDPVMMEVEKGQIRRFAAAIGEDGAIHYDEALAKEAGFTSLVGPPTFASALHTTAGLYDELGLDDSNIMHAEEEYEYFRPIVAGDEINVTHAIADIYDKQTPTGSLVFVVIETRGNDTKGRPVFKGRRVLVELKRD
ncbi:MAG: MaoC family dehydratase N-terminal domain-containing protein [Clostridia bacterium]|nr:MaoC family dehydratase N-terminal domain-containing protein [Deltaproteobacteria bacterium]